MGCWCRTKWLQNGLPTFPILFGMAPPKICDSSCRKLGKRCCWMTMLRTCTPGRRVFLSEHACVNFLSGLNRRALPWHFQKAGEDVVVLPRSTMLVNDASAYVQCGRAGFGVIQVPGLLVDRYLKDGDLPLRVIAIAVAPTAFAACRAAKPRLLDAADRTT